MCIVFESYGLCHAVAEGLVRKSVEAGTAMHLRQPDRETVSADRQTDLGTAVGITLVIAVIGLDVFHL